MLFGLTVCLLHRNQVLDILAENADNLDILAALWNNEVDITLRRLDKLLVHGFQYFQITVYNHGNRSSTVYRVALNVAYQSLIRAAVDEYFQVHQVAQLLVEQRHNTLDDDDGLRFHSDGFGQPVALEIVVGGLLDSMPLA